MLSSFTAEAWGAFDRPGVRSRVQLDLLQSAETASVQSGEGCEQVLAAVVAVVLINRRVNADDQWPVAETRSPVGPPQSQVMTVDLQTNPHWSSEGL